MLLKHRIYYNKWNCAESTKVGLKINIGKTKELRVNSKTSSACGSIIELVNSFTYLGSNIAANGGASLMKSHPKLKSKSSMPA